MGALGEGSGALESWWFAKGCSGWASGAPTWQGAPGLAISWLWAGRRQGGRMEALACEVCLALLDPV